MGEEIVILGIILSIIFYEVTDLSPGGVIVPGYLALFLDNPKRVLFTIMLSILTYFVVRGLSQYTILYGRRKFVVFIIVTFILKYILGYMSIDFLDKSLIIGILVPGILAQDIDKNGCFKTISALSILTITIKVISNFYYRGGFF
ncbi:poly-gamma-glutamate biosynthesis protein PgsC [Cetobacterium sp. 2A]|uniref:poly-gamma-glutamate biosynthesis protein PgsC n=1 Tax=unclassified Cetobacterium TaxID=2630983 RepID=UPI00163B72C9|nr:poly-gamma-glutamate biosynthesis protein PgsC [Cetobacterium sp. 2A]MBC2855031.1 poly-gamma-glutamate biosynthesis protein PgsC [Cetobacterium sp. 2A]